jgi:predicted DNA-binding protein (MmcQ/YjbR family)
MCYPWLDAYCLAKKGCEKDYKAEWEALRYLLGGKMFAMQGTDKEGNAIITLKIEPSHGAALRQDYKDIVPGYYMNKLHWNSVRLDGAVPDNILKEMIDESYQILLNSLPKKMQKEFV